MYLDRCLPAMVPQAKNGRMMRILSWNLYRTVGATAADVAALIRAEAPDIVLMQEATAETDVLPDLVGGCYTRVPMPDRSHGLAAWSAVAPLAPEIMRLPTGRVIPVAGARSAMVLSFGGITLVNVHFNHGQLLVRRQFRSITRGLRGSAAVIGDFNTVGPILTPDWRDVGPRAVTHMAKGVVPLRLDRVLTQQMRCDRAIVLRRGRSDHRPILVELEREAAYGSRAERLRAAA